MLLLDTAKLVPVTTEPSTPDTGLTPLEPDFDGFLRMIGTRAFRFAEIGLRRREDALDAVQDTMEKMLGYRDRPAEEWNPLFWSVLRNRITDLHRRNLFRLRWLLPGSTDRDGEPMDWADEAPDPQRSHESRQAWTRIRDALHNLPDRQREAFTLRVLEELDVTETAQVMGCSEGSVKTHLSRARAALQKQLEDVR